MGWQTIGSGQYYTRSVREGGKVRREYVGSGSLAVLAAYADAQAREEKAKKRAEQQQAREAEDEETRVMRWYCRAVEGVLRSELTAAGYHQHDRGEWRKKKTAEKRIPGMETEVVQAAKAELARRQEERKQPVVRMQRMMDAQVSAPIAAVPDTVERRRTIIEAAMNGDAALEAQALACVRAYPTETVLGWGNPKRPCLDLVYPGGNRPGVKVVQAVIEDEYRLKQKQIEGDNPTPLEKLLAERITALRFQLTHFERLYECKIAAGGMSLEASDHHAKRIERVSKQYLRAIEALAKVRRLQLPAVLVGQMNIGENQVNLGGKQLNVMQD